MPNNNTKKRPCDFCKEPLDLIRENNELTVYCCTNKQCPIEIIEIIKESREYDEYDIEDEYDEAANG